MHEIIEHGMFLGSKTEKVNLEGAFAAGIRGAVAQRTQFLPAAFARTAANTLNSFMI